MCCISSTANYTQPHSSSTATSIRAEYGRSALLPTFIRSSLCARETLVSQGLIPLRCERLDVCSCFSGVHGALVVVKMVVVCVCAPNMPDICNKRAVRDMCVRFEYGCQSCGSLQRLPATSHKLLGWCQRCMYSKHLPGICHMHVA